MTVEDPNPKFRLLRDLTDARNCVAKQLLVPASVSEPPSEAQLEAARDALLLTDEQLLRCYELQQFELLQKSKKGKAAEAELEKVEKPFRLAIKRRLGVRLDRRKQEPRHVRAVEPSRQGAFAYQPGELAVLVDRAVCPRAAEVT